MTHKTKAIILKTVAYGETSLIITALTELFGIQTYIVKGVRKGDKSRAAKANHFQYGAILEMVVYHQTGKQINFIREFKWAVIYKTIYQNIFKNAVALYTIELLQKCVRQPDDNPELFYFSEDILMHLDNCTDQNAANFPLFIAVHLPSILGFQIIDNYSPEYNILDLQDGRFVADHAGHTQIITEPKSGIVSQLLKARHPEELYTMHWNGNSRRQLLNDLEIFFQLHIADFGKIKTLPILHEILS